jgi:hypothetical protein
MAGSKPKSALSRCTAVDTRFLGASDQNLTFDTHRLGLEATPFGDIRHGREIETPVIL